MNRPIRTLAIGCLLLFALLLGNVNYVQVIKANDLNDRGSNKRARDAECARKRGAILVDGETIAESVPSGDKLKYQRKYYNTELYAPVTGYFSCLYGTSGIEASQNSLLSGSDERLFVNRVVDLVGNKQPRGGSVLLTLNAKAQQAALTGLQNLPGETRGAVVALDPETGAILAMVSVPTYNPNLIASHDLDAASKVWKRLNDDPAKRMLNRATQEVYPPGSTFKVVTAAAALAAGYTPQTQVKAGYSLDLPLSSDELNNENGSNCGGSQVTFTQALQVSCNVAFGSIGLDLGDSALRSAARSFGFDSDIFDELPAATSRFPDEVDEPQTALSAIGQYEVAASPLQMALVTAGVANGGVVMRPYVVQEVRDPGLDLLDEAEPQMLQQAMSGDDADDLTQMMVEVVEGGTGGSAKIPGVPVAAKTGTANSARERSPYAWIVTFAPADDPQVAVAVLVEQTGVNRADISGGGLAGPIAKAVMEAVVTR